MKSIKSSKLAALIVLSVITCLNFQEARAADQKLDINKLNTIDPGTRAHLQAVTVGELAKIQRDLEYQRKKVCKESRLTDLRDAMGFIGHYADGNLPGKRSSESVMESSAYAGYDAANRRFQKGPACWNAYKAEMDAAVIFDERSGTVSGRSTATLHDIKAVSAPTSDGSVSKSEGSNVDGARVTTEH